MAWKENVEFFARIIRFVRGPAMSRWGGVLIVAAIALYSNVLQLAVVGLFAMAKVPLTLDVIPWYVAPLFLISGVLLIVLYHFFPESLLPQAYPHDEKLIAYIRTEINSDVLYFLREHDIGGSSIHQEWIDPLYRIGRLEGAEYDFINEQIQEKWKALRDANKSFVKLALQHLDDAYPYNRNRLTPYRDGEAREFPTPETEAKIKSLNNATTEIAKRFDDLDAITRRLIPNVV